jgi:hypothetical protein
MKTGFDRLPWPHKWYGIWEGTVHTVEVLPSVLSAIDPSWEPDDKGGLMSYVAQAPVVLTASPSSRCLLCPSEVPTSCWQSDGVWLWPKSLTHYLYWHSVVLPEQFVEHIRNQNYIPPAETGVPTHALPWPETWTVYRQWGLR